MAQERDSSGRFKPKDSEKRKIENVKTVDSLEDLQPPKQGLTEEEGMTRLDEVLPEGVEGFDEDRANLEGYAPEEFEGDPEAFREAMERLREDGSTEAAVDALEEMDLDALEGDAPSEDVGEAGEPIPWETVAEQTGLDADRVMVRAKVQGEEMEIPLSEAVQGYQRREDYTRKTDEVATKRKGVDSLIELNLARLGELFPQAKTPQQQRQIAQAYQRVLAERQALHAHHLETEVLPEENAKLAEALDWETEEDFESGKERLKAGALEYGFSPSDLEMVTDHKLLVLLNDAISYREMQDRAEDAKASARANRRQGRTLKPGTSGSQKTHRPSKLSEAKRRLARTGREEDAVAALDHILPDDII